MTNNTQILGLLVIFIIYLILSELYLKRILNIREVKKGLFIKGRRKIFVSIEIILMILFVYVIASGIVIFAIFLFFALLYFLRGIEEWLEKKSQKGHYHDWLGSIIFLVMFLFMLIGEFY
ncbi:DUF4181 domain-containing protein [Cytobacillus sp. FJAT-54145]|uniref:DUF4181 domain-containing protein n=1 Tax=Cytobacillus spartinae TaxID=3299023 RepID=A0ABW6K808_9BACI